MGYDLHITRAGWWTRSPEYPISRQEWQIAAEAWPDMSVEGERGYAPAYALRVDGEHPASLYWQSGQINVRADGADTGEIARLAETMRARLIGDDGEQYLPNGAVKDSDANERPNLLARPLYVNEVAGAWRSLLEWEDCVDDWPPASQALRTFRDLAMREVATSDLPDADMLLYGYGKRVFYGEQTFSVSMTRQFALPDVAGGDVVRVECNVRYRPAPELIELGSFYHRAPSGGPEERSAWLSDISDRPEWAVFDRVLPDDLTLCGDAIYNSRISEARRTDTPR